MTYCSTLPAGVLKSNFSRVTGAVSAATSLIARFLDLDKTSDIERKI